jgi:hypothetical protein
MTKRPGPYKNSSRHDNQEVLLDKQYFSTAQDTTKSKHDSSFIFLNNLIKINIVDSIKRKEERKLTFRQTVSENGNVRHISA